MRIGSGRNGRPSTSIALHMHAGRESRSELMNTMRLSVETGTDRGFTDLTGACRRFVAEHAGGGGGLLSGFVPHATAGGTILELGAGSDDRAMAALGRLPPRGDPWRP